MYDPINKLRTPGVISGFSEISTDPAGTPSELTPAPNFSAADLLMYMSRLLNTLDPKKLEDFKRTIMTHIQDTNNPHHIKLSDLTDDFVKHLFSDFMPGEPLTAQPTYSLMALTAPINNVTCLRQGNVNIINEAGYIEQVGSDELAIDYGTGFPSLITWESRTNLIPNNSIKHPPELTFLNSEEAVLLPNIKSPDVVVTPLSITTAQVNDVHGMEFTPIGTPGNRYTTAFYYYPHRKGYLFLTYGDAKAVYDITNNAVVALSQNTNIHIHTLANGWLDISFDYPFLLNTTLKITYSDTILETYDGEPEMLIFSITGLRHMQGKGLCPYIKTTNGPASITGSSIVLPSFVKLPSQGTLVFDLDGAMPETDRVLLQIGSLNVITITPTAVICSIGGNLIIQNTSTLKRIVFSYGSNGMLLRTSGNTNTLIATPIQHLSTLSPTINSFPGNLLEFTIYPQEANLMNADFLVKENLNA